MNPIERAAALSPWAQVNVGEKALLFMGLLFLAISVPPLPLLPIIAVVAVCLACIARVDWRIVGVIVGGSALFLAVGTIPLIWALTTHGFVHIPGGEWDAARVLSRAIVGMFITVTFALITPMAEIVVWLGRCGVPGELVHVIVLMYRMTASLVATAHSMWEAQAQRLGHSTRRRWIASAAGQTSSLFVISFARARRLQEGLELRADPSSMRTLDRPRPVRPGWLIGTVALLVALGISAFFLR